jgi:hypothetical protein
LLVTLGLAIGVFVALMISVLVEGDDSSTSSGVLAATPIAADQPAVAADFIRAYGAFRSATFVAQYAVTREAGDQVAHYTRTLVQRLPDRVVREDGSADNRGTFSADDVLEEQATLATYFAGPTPAYRIERDGDCFAIDLYQAMLDPPMGYEARWCFAANATLQEQATTFNAYSETETATAVRTTVTDADLAG